MPGRTGDPNGCRCHAVLQDFFANKISSPEAATKLAAAALPANSSASTVAERLSYLWQLIVKTACENRDYQVKLVDVLIDLSRLPDITKPNDEKGQSESLLVEGGRVWKDLPLLGPTVRDWWNLDIDPDTAPQERQKTTDMVVLEIDKIDTTSPPSQLQLQQANTHQHPILPPTNILHLNSETGPTTERPSIAPMSLETFPYGDHDLQTVTVAHPYPAPTNTENDTSYWVILIHGGAWRDPTQTATSYLTPALSILTSQHPQQPITGLASISYRLSPHPSHQQDLSNVSPTSVRTAKHPDHIADVQAALSFLEAKYKIGRRYVLVGHSCGATLAFQAVMESLTPATSKTGAGYGFPVAILGMAGIYNLRLLRDSHREISAYQEIIEGAFGGDENVWDAVSPGVVGVDAWEEGRVVVLAHSEGDELCDVAQSEEMKRRLRGWEEDKSSGQRKVHVLSIEGKHDEAWEKGTELARAIVFTLSRLQEAEV